MDEAFSGAFDLPPKNILPKLTKGIEEALAIVLRKKFIKPFKLCF